MKKILLFISVLTMFCFCSCGNTNKVNTPDVITLNGTSVSYYDSEIPEIFWDSDVEFKVNSDNQIRNITITSPDVETYNDISVGDSVNEIKSKYTHEQNMNHIYMVVFLGDKEIEAGTHEATNEYIIITYLCDDDTINTISICDALYAKTMK